VIARVSRLHPSRTSTTPHAALKPESLLLLMIPPQTHCRRHRVVYGPTLTGRRGESLKIADTPKAEAGIW
jgi:hypothetical protein